MSIEHPEHAQYQQDLVDRLIAHQPFYDLIAQRVTRPARDHVGLMRWYRGGEYSHFASQSGFTPNAYTKTQLQAVIAWRPKLRVTQSDGNIFLGPEFKGAVILLTPITNDGQTGVVFTCISSPVPNAELGNEVQAAYLSRLEDQLDMLRKGGLMVTQTTVMFSEDTGNGTTGTARRDGSF